MKKEKMSRFLSTKLAPVLGAGAIGACPLCWAGSAAFLSYVGLGSLIPMWQWLAGILLTLGLVGFLFDYRSHKNIKPSALYVLGAVGLFVGRYVFGGALVWVPSIAIIFASIIYNRSLFKKSDNRDAKYKQAEELKGNIENKTTKITCPKCGHVQEEKVPDGKCQPFYVCNGCGKTISTPKESKNCCVFCEYAEDKCPMPNVK